MTTITPELEAFHVKNATCRQIGAGTIMSICGGRMGYQYDADGVDTIFKCGSGYEVRVRYEFARDTYTVTRGFRRGLSYWVKGEMTDVYCDALSEVVYRAGMFRDEWTTNGARKVV